MPEKPKIIDFDEIPTYVNKGGKNQLCRDMLKKGEFGHIAVGHNVMQTEACNGANTHKTWNQTFIVTRGSGTAVLDGIEHRVQAPSVITIPAGVEHDVVTGIDDEIEYLYINDYLD